MELNRKDRRFHNKMKKQIAELLLVGEQPEGMDKALNDSMSVAEQGEGSSKPDRDIGEKISRKFAASRKERQPGPEIFLTLSRLGGFLVSHQEISDLVHFSLIGPTVNKPRWCNLRPWKSTSQTVVVRVNCPSRFIETEGESFTSVDEFFNREWIKMDTDIYDREEFWKNIFNVPVALQQQIRERMMKLSSSTIPQGDLKIDMLMPYSDMADIGFPFPDDCALIVPTKDKYAPVTPSSPMFALDCEMVFTDAGMHELARVSIIREDGSVLLDTLVKPTTRITDYLTKYSGITPALLDPITITLSDVQNAIRACLPPDAILVGHSLEFDMRALRMAHPYCLDIGSLFNISGNTRKRTGLKTLSSVFLDEDIQDESGHCSVIDAWATMRLMKMKIDKGLIFGNITYGWSYDEFVQEYEQQVKIEGCEKKKDEPTKKKKKSSDEVIQLRKCSCGQSVGVPCIVDNCRCQVSPPTQCVLCLSKLKCSEDDEKRSTIDWSSSIRPKEVISSRPLPFYLLDSKKNILSAIDKIEEDIPSSHLLTTRSLSSFDSISQMFSHCSLELLEYALSLMEYTYRGDIPNDKDKIQEVMNIIDNIIQQVLTSAAKYALIILIFSSEKTSICYVKVKK